MSLNESLIFFADELTKIADNVSSQEAIAAVKRLRELDANKPTADQLARGALTGALVGPAAALANRAVSGELGKGISSGVSQAMSAPTRGGKALGLGKALVGGIRGLGGAAAGSAVVGAGLPSVRRHFDQEAEKAKLRDYLGQSRGGHVRTSVKKALGV